MEDGTGIPSDDVRMVEFMAHLLMQNGQWEKALTLYDMLLRLDAGEPRKMLAASYLLLNLNRAEEALARLDWLIANKGAAISDTLALLRARALVAVGRHQEAQETLRDPAHIVDAHSW